VPFETALTTVSALGGIHDAVVFGMNHAYIGVLIIPASGTDQDTVRALAWDLVDSVNATVSSHAKVPSSDMIVILPPGSQFSKSSKGTVQRTLVYKAHEDVITAAYQRFETGSSTEGLHFMPSSPEDTEDYVLSVIRDVVRSSASGSKGASSPLSADTDLFGFGVDSLQSARIRNRLQSDVDLRGGELSANVVYEHATPRRLAALVFAMSQGRLGQLDAADDDHSLMLALVNKYATLSVPDAALSLEREDDQRPGETLVSLIRHRALLIAHVQARYSQARRALLVLTS
jgi:hypothetical protein